MKFEVTILGSGSATPTLRRHATAHYVNARERYFLVDCAEGTQLQLRRYKAHVQRLHAVFISHLHGDHYLGLIGLISTMHLLGRKTPLKVYAPAGLMEIFKVHWKMGKTTVGFPIDFHALAPGKAEELYADSQVFVRSFPLNHRIDCWGFRIEEQPLKRKVNKAAVEAHAVPVAWMKRIVDGEDFVNAGGETIPNTELTRPPRPPKAYAFCSDTCYDESIVPHIRGVDLLYHEATFAEAMKQRAAETYHATARQAGSIAQKAEVKQLVIGHYSARYRSAQPLLEEARAVFPNTVAGEDGLTLTL